jgi:hypothetical protein
VEPSLIAPDYEPFRSGTASVHSGGATVPPLKGFFYGNLQQSRNVGSQETTQDQSRQSQKNISKTCRIKSCHTGTNQQKGFPNSLGYAKEVSQEES